MSPFLEAKAVYEREPCRREFFEDVCLHLMHGFVFSTPEFFIMGRPVLSSAPAEMVVTPSVQWPRESCDCWHIYLFAGDMTKAWTILPWQLPKISFERKNELRFYRFRDIRRLSLTPTHDALRRGPARHPAP